MEHFINLLFACGLLIVVVFWVIVVPHLYARKLNKKDNHHFGMDIEQTKETHDSKISRKL